MKIALGIEYLGSAYLGWQKQDISPTIQEIVESALSKIADENIRLTCAGRTDTGVHAIQQVVHFETDSVRDTEAWVLGSNSKLPGDITITWAREIEDDFHARFSAENRTYQYLILNRRARPGILNGLVTWECRELDSGKMQEAAKCLIGKHDFTSYRAVSCQSKSPVREVQTLQIDRIDNWILITIRANAFLHHMVRNIAGVLMAIGYGKESTGWAKEVLLAKDRAAGGITAPPNGLYLVNVKYPDRYDIPKCRTLIETFNLSVH